jgi:hypothetical protein
MDSCFGCKDGLFVFGSFQTLLFVDFDVCFAENKYFDECYLKKLGK